MNNELNECTESEHFFDESLLSAYLDNEITNEDRITIDKRLQAEPALRKTLADLQQVRRWIQSAPLPAQPLQTIHGEWSLPAGENPVFKTSNPERTHDRSRVKFWSSLLALAASLLIVVSSTYLLPGRYRQVTLQPKSESSKQVTNTEVAGKQVESVPRVSSLEFESNGRYAKEMPATTALAIQPAIVPMTTFFIRVRRTGKTQFGINLTGNGLETDSRSSLSNNDSTQLADSSKSESLGMPKTEITPQAGGTQDLRQTDVDVLKEAMASKEFGENSTGDIGSSNGFGASAGLSQFHFNDSMKQNLNTVREVREVILRRSKIDAFLDENQLVQVVESDKSPDVTNRMGEEAINEPAIKSFELSDAKDNRGLASDEIKKSAARDEAVKSTELGLQDEWIRVVFEIVP